MSSCGIFCVLSSLFKSSSTHAYINYCKYIMVMILRGEQPVSLSRSFFASTSLWASWSCPYLACNRPIWTRNQEPVFNRALNWWSLLFSIVYFSCFARLGPEDIHLPLSFIWTGVFSTIIVRRITIIFVYQKLHKTFKSFGTNAWCWFPLVYIDLLRKIALF